MKYFLSHDKSLKNEVAIPLLQELSKIGIKCWFDRTNIVTGSQIYNEINIAVQESYICIALINSEYLLRTWTQQELCMFHDKETQLNTLNQILPIYCGIEKEQVYEVFPWLKARAFEKIEDPYQISDFEKNEVVARVVNHYFYEECPAIDFTELGRLNLKHQNNKVWSSLYNTLISTRYYLSTNFPANIIELWNIQKALFNLAEDFHNTSPDIQIAMQFLSAQKQLSFIEPKQVTYNVYTACSRAVISSFHCLKRALNCFEDIGNRS